MVVGRADDDFLQNLDVVVSHLGKRCRFPVPLPSHLRPELGDAAHLETLPLSSQHSSRRSGGQQAADDRAAAAASFSIVNERIAHDECIASVTNVKEWLQRVRSARSDGTATLNDIKTLSDRLQSLCDISKSVRDQSDLLSANASSLMVRKARLEHVQDALQQSIRKFTKVEDLIREAEHPLLSAASARFPLLLEEMEDTMQYLSENQNLKSAKPYATKLALAQQRALICLRDAVCATFVDSQRHICASSAFASAFRDKANIPLSTPLLSAPHSTSATSSTAVGTTNAALSQMLVAEGGDEGIEADALRALLASLNEDFIKHLDGSAASLRRLAEARCVVFEEDVHLTDILASYREARAGIVYPIVRDWLAAAEKSILNTKEQDSATTHDTLQRFASTVASFLRDVLVEEKMLFESIWLREDVCSSWELLANDIGEQLYHSFRSRLLQTDGLEELAFGVEALREALEASSAPEYMTLIKRMMQDTQERMVFRTSVYLRSVIGSRKITIGEPRATLTAITSLVRGGGGDVTEATADEAGSSDTHHVVPVHASLESCIYFLQTLYPALERNVFGVFADECIHMTLVFLSKFVKQMQSLQSAELSNAILFGNLYHLRHLLLLRETITRFEVTLVTEEKMLDLTQLAQRKIEILQSSREAKKDIESDMKRVCEDIISALVASVVKKSQAAGSAGGAEEYVAECEQMLSHFVESPSTRLVLLRPIQMRIKETLQPAGDASSASTAQEAVHPPADNSHQQ